MMKGFLISVKRLWAKNIGSNITVTVMAFLTCYMMALSFNQIYGFYYEYNFFKDSSLNNSLFFMGREGTNITDYENDIFYTAIDTGLRDKLLEYCEKKGAIKGVYGMMDYYDEANSCEVYIYDEITASYLGKGISGKGDWIFENGKTEDGCYPIVIHKGVRWLPDEEAGIDPETGDYPYKEVMMAQDEFNIGDVIDMDIKLELEMKSPDDTTPIKNVNVKGKIVGTAEKIEPFRFMVYGRWGNLIDTVGQTFRRYIVDDNAIIFFPYDEELFKGYEFCGNTALIYFRDDITEEEIQDVYSYAKSLGYCQLGRDMVDMSKKTADEVFRSYFFLLYLFVGLTLIAIVCVSFLNVKKVKKIFSIYYLNGCSFFRSVGIYLTYFLSMYGSAFLLFLAAMGIPYNIVRSESFDDAQMFITDPKVALAALLAGIAVSLISTAVPFLIMKKKTAVQNLKET
ncbi:MAG: hypothetical protein HDT44_11500 [Ruminococcaceae bacterium]|nr:hypothetical protein [Oscillospiraceae bacterium]